MPSLTPLGVLNEDCLETYDWFIRCYAKTSPMPMSTAFFVFSQYPISQYPTKGVLGQG